MSQPTDKYIASLLDVMKLLDSLVISERNRATLRRACSESIVRAEDDLLDEYGRRNSWKAWSKEDISLLRDSCSSEADCSSFAQENILLLKLQQRLGRTKKAIKTKAIEFGLGSKVDYWMNHQNAR